MIHWNARDLVPLSQVRKELPKRPAVSTLWRWAIKGCRGVKLETLMIGGTRYTTAEAVQNFFEAITQGTEADDARKPAHPTERTSAAEEECKRLGI